MPNHAGIEIDFSRDSKFDEIGLERLKDSYTMEGETSPQQRYAYVASQFSSNPEHAQRIYEYMSNHWFGPSTPVLSYGRNAAGLPVSCFLNTVPDSKEGLVDTLSETNWLSMLGGGVGVYFNIRGADEKSVGVIPHMGVYDRSSGAYKQGTTRRGSYAMYLDISHPDIIEFLDMRKETGDQNRRCQNLHHGVNIPDSFMEIIDRCMRDKDADDSWELRDPASGKLHEVVSAKDLWIRLLELRSGAGRGEPYIHFIGNSNKAVKQVLKDRGYYIRQSNLCLVGDTQISVRCAGVEEMVPLDLFVARFEMGYYTEAPQVKTWNGQDTTWSTVTAAAETAVVEELYEIETPKGNVIKCTGNHKIFTKNRGYVEAQHLVETDEVLE